MLNDVVPPERRRRSKLKRIEPLEKAPSPSIHELAAAEPGFETPEQIAATTESNGDPTVVHHEQPRQRKFNLKLQWPTTRRQQLIGLGLLVVVGLTLGAGWTLTHHKRNVTASGTPTKVKKIAATPIYSNLSGLPISDASLNQKPVTAVMVENSLDARPQSGLSQAGVVFEAVAEGGVTRFMALYQDTAPDNVGPIRSARPYYVQWALGFHAAYAHVGGSDDALADISAWGVQDMNQFYNGSYYHRISSRDAPHNVYTGIGTLNQLEAAKGYSSSFTGFARKSDQAYKAPSATAKPATPADARTPATSINFSLSGPLYDPSYVYNASTNSYNRSENGSPQTDANTNQQLSPKVVVAIVVPLSRGALDSSGAYYSDYDPVGSGQAYIFQDGTVTVGQWNKADNTTALSFTDSNGKPLTLNRGQTWISAVSASSGVTYK